MGAGAFGPRASLGEVGLLGVALSDGADLGRRCADGVLGLADAAASCLGSGGGVLGLGAVLGEPFDGFDEGGDFGARVIVVVERVALKPAAVALDHHRIGGMTGFRRGLAGRCGLGRCGFAWGLRRGAREVAGGDRLSGLCFFGGDIKRGGLLGALGAVFGCSGSRRRRCVGGVVRGAGATRPCARQKAERAGVKGHGVEQTTARLSRCGQTTPYIKDRIGLG